MINSMKISYKELGSIIIISPIDKLKNKILTVSVNEFLDKIEFFKKEPKFPITIRLILPKTIIFNPLQNDHVILNSYDPTEEYLISWKIECVTLPCQDQKIEAEIMY